MSYGANNLEFTVNIRSRFGIYDNTHLVHNFAKEEIGKIDADNSRHMSLSTITALLGKDRATMTKIG
ncbi:hypothetical protein [Sinorhizobium meliloti]|uniref:hypothetical protein n=1 Tax=Rhizobium meliloti TaxID=382 RepID=UPI000FD8B3E5|nr:hypothetical protein [Sinorhizobium meliloti]RVO68360.1 hypothetical protein CN087_12865 [Sinorhizobium meliloti]